MARLNRPILGLCSALLAQALFFVPANVSALATTSIEPEIVVKIMDAETGRPIPNRRVDIYVDKMGAGGNSESVGKITTWTDVNGVVKKRLANLPQDAEYQAWAVTLNGVSHKETLQSSTRLEIWEVGK